MRTNPYESLAASAFWRSGVADLSAAPDVSYCSPKWPITRHDRIATAGSCFAQHIGKRLRSSGYCVIDAEPAPSLLPAERRAEHGYGIYSARYGNIYTPRQMLQLAEEAFELRPLSQEAWKKQGTYVDALRPTVDKIGHASPEAVILHRTYHLVKVRQLLLDCELFVFTLGLTETWEDLRTNRVLPVCPGTIAGEFDSNRYRFRNFTFSEAYDDMVKLRSILQQQRGAAPRMLLTVSPVPLTATASGKHVMQATVYSKSVLRSVAGQLADTFEDVDYFPSYEIVANPWAAGTRYAENMRSVLDTSVALVMNTFMAIYSGAEKVDSASVVAASKISTTNAGEKDSDHAMRVICDEELLSAFGPRKS